MKTTNAKNTIKLGDEQAVLNAINKNNNKKITLQGTGEKEKKKREKRNLRNHHCWTFLAVVLKGRCLVAEKWREKMNRWEIATPLNTLWIEKKRFNKPKDERFFI